MTQIPSLLAVLLLLVAALALLAYARRDNFSAMPLHRRRGPQA